MSLKRDLQELAAKAAKIKLVVTDVDGVWTDGGMYYSETGDELKKFNTRDGMGVELLCRQGIQVAVLTSENTEIVGRRARKLDLSLVWQGVKDKRAKILEITRELGLGTDETAYIGDDINDIQAIRICGLTATVSDGMECIKEAVDYVCERRGGEGAFREFAELILHAVTARLPVGRTSQ